MRKARVLDWQRRLREKKEGWPLSLTRVAVKDIPSLGSIEIPFFSPLTVIAGPNGVGKSTLLKAMWACLDPSRATEAVKGNRKLVAGSASVGFQTGGEAGEAAVEFSADEIRILNDPSLVVTHIDSSRASTWDQSHFCTFESAEDLTNGSGALNLDATTLGEVSYILRRDYRSIVVYEVEFDSHTTPFFEVTYGDDRYDSRTMGSGEIAALYVWWALGRVPKDSIVLIEEPEAFLSAASQRALTNHIIKSTVEKHLTVVVSSHSPYLIGALPRESLHFLSRGQAGLQLVTDQPPPLLLSNLGIEFSTVAILFVEDSLGRDLTKAVLERFDPALSRRIVIAVKNGEGEITAALRATQGLVAPIKILGAFDGDQRGKVAEDVAKISAFLPGDSPIELQFKEAVTGDPSAASDVFGFKNLAAVLGGLEGANIHDWYEEIGRALGLTRSQLFPGLLKLWMASDVNSKAFVRTYEDIAALLVDPE